MPNGGTSLPDGVRRIEAALGDLRADVTMLKATASARHDADPLNGMFEANAHGENISVNQTYARFVGVGKDDLLGWRFLNFIHPDDLKRVRFEWDSAIEETRPFHQRYKMITASGETITVDATATPITDGQPVKRWVGIVLKTGAGSVLDDRF